jgi:sodium pump decarboxylase gamma subunit
MNEMLLTGGAQITKDSSLLDRLSLGGSTLLLGMVIVFTVLGIIFIALEIMRSVFTKKAVAAKKAESAKQEAQESAKPVEAIEEPVAAPAPAPADEFAVVAAIVAAISAHTGKSPEAFRVVSFKKRK